MRLVRATQMSAVKRVKIKELGRIAKAGETFEVTDERFNILSGNNKFKTIFVTPVKPLPTKSEVVKTVTTTVGNKVEKKVEVKPVETVEVPVVEEESEIYLIEPGKEPVRVDADLKPIVKDLVSDKEFEEAKAEILEDFPPKKKRTKKTESSELVEKPKKTSKKVVDSEVVVEEKPKKRKTKAK